MGAQFPDRLINILRSAQSVAVLTGAGVSAESGIPTFREAQTGLWSIYRPEDLATPQAFAANPKLVWDWYAWRRKLVSEALPNPGHRAIVELEAHYPNFAVITQNVDSLHQRAGSHKVIELHGNISRIKCSKEGLVIEDWIEGIDHPPRCPRCGSYMRPDVVWFGEGLPPHQINAAVEAARGCQVFLSIGTSSLVEPAASLPLIARDAGATIIEINLSSTPLSPFAQFLLTGTSGDILPSLLLAIIG